MADQISLFPQVETKFPKTRYQGSKAKLTNWIWDKISGLDFETALDAFGGTGTISYRLKQENKRVTYVLCEIKMVYALKGLQFNLIAKSQDMFEQVSRDFCN